MKRSLSWAPTLRGPRYAHIRGQNANLLLFLQRDCPFPGYLRRGLLVLFAHPYIKTCGPIASRIFDGLVEFFLSFIPSLPSTNTYGLGKDRARLLLLFVV